MNISQYLALSALAGSLLGAPVAAFAQPAPSPAPTDIAPAHGDTHAHGGHRNPMRRALDSLDLTPDQQTQIRALTTSYRASRQTSTPETRKELRAKVEAVLTPDQRTRFEAAMRRDRQERAQAQAAPSASP